MELSNVYLLAAVMLVFVLAFVEVVKKVSPSLDEKYLPLISLVLGLLVGALSLPFSEFDTYTTLVAGLVSGLVVCGAFDLSKVIKK